MPTYKHRPCQFCKKEIRYIDYKNVKLLEKSLSQYRKIVPRYYSGVCLKHQKTLATAIKHARIMGLVPFSR